MVGTPGNMRHGALFPLQGSEYPLSRMLQSMTFQWVHPIWKFCNKAMMLRGRNHRPPQVQDHSRTPAHARLGQVMDIPAPCDPLSPNESVQMPVVKNRTHRTPPTNKGVTLYNEIYQLQSWTASRPASPGTLVKFICFVQTAPCSSPHPSVVCSDITEPRPRSLNSINHTTMNHRLFG